MDESKLHSIVGQVLQDLGGAFSVPLVQIGESLGIYEALNESGPCTSTDLAASTGLDGVTCESGCALWLPRTTLSLKKTIRRFR